MSVICDIGILQMIDEGLVDFSRSEIDPITLRSQVNPNTMDLSLGLFVRWPRNSQNPVVFGKPYAADEFWELRKIDPQHGILLEPGDIFLGCSREFLRIPRDVCRQVFTIQFRPCFYQSHDGRGDRCRFRGTITLELKNEGKHSIILPYGARVVQIQFNRLEMIPERDYSQRINRYQGQIQPEPAREERL